MSPSSTRWDNPSSFDIGVHPDTSRAPTLKNRLHARREARLGALAQALVVDDPRSAARAVHARPAALPHVLLVPSDVNLDEQGHSTLMARRSHRMAPARNAVVALRAEELARTCTLRGQAGDGSVQVHGRIGAATSR